MAAEVKSDLFNLIDDESGCPVCDSNDVGVCSANETTFSDNFYLRAIREQLDVTIDDLKNLFQVFECYRCSTIFCNPWFNAETGFNIFHHVYGQHNRGWEALYGWLRKREIQEYWAIVEVAESILGRSLKHYAEYHCPFQGNFFRYRSLELPESIKTPYYKESCRYLRASTPGKWLSTSLKIKSKAIHYRRNISKKRLEKLDQHQSPHTTRRYLILEPSTRFWDYNCIADGVNCKSLGSMLLNLAVVPLYELLRTRRRMDVIAFINTLDHTNQPLDLLDKALEISDLVFIVNHAQQIITKQHKFVFRPGFENFLREEKGYFVKNLANQASFSSNEQNQDKLSLVVSTDPF